MPDYGSRTDSFRPATHLRSSHTGGLPPDSYKEWYESIDAANAEAINRQVISNQQADSDLKNLAKTYENMKPAEAAAVLEKLANLDTVAEILSAMKAESRAKIMDEFDAAFAANVTKKLMP